MSLAISKNVFLNIFAITFFNKANYNYIIFSDFLQVFTAIQTTAQNTCKLINFLYRSTMHNIIKLKTMYY